MSQEESKAYVESLSRTFDVAGMLGRADDMLNVRGVTLFPSSIEDVVRRIPRLGAEFAIVLTKERDVRFARTVGRENVIAGTDCGFGTFIGASAVAPSVAWAKLRSLAEGARLASKELW